MELEQLRQLLAIAEVGTFSGAADRMHLSQPSLSRSMKRLEADLHHRLFDRYGNRAVLNDAGRLAVERSRDVLAAEQRMRDSLDELTRRRRTLRIATVAPAPVWNLTARIVERFGGVVPTPELASDAEVERRLQEHTADLAITRRPVTLPDRRCVPLMTETLSLLAPTNHPLATRHEVGFADMTGETFLLLEWIGFWKEVCEQSIPEARFIFQNDAKVFLQTIRTSELLCFTTDAPQNRGQVEDRVSVPISDASAQAAFYLVSRTDAPARVAEIVDWVATHQGA